MYKPSGLRSPAVRSDYGCCPYRRERWELNNGVGRVLGPFLLGIICTYVVCMYYEPFCTIHLSIYASK